MHSHLVNVCGPKAVPVHLMPGSRAKRKIKMRQVSERGVCKVISGRRVHQI